MRKHIGIFLLVISMVFIGGCGKSNQQFNAGTEGVNGSSFVSGDESGNEDSQMTTGTDEEPGTESSSETAGPITITHTDHDYVSVQISKELYNPEIEGRQFQATFYDEQNNPCLYLFISDGKDWCQCKICYGEIGDTSKSIVSDYGKYKDLGDSVLFEIILNDPTRTIAGGDNLTVPNEVFEKPVSIMYPNLNDEWLSADATQVFVFEVNEERIKAAEEINKILYTCDLDREYLTPESEDYRVEIYEIPKVTVYRTASTIRPPGAPLRFGTDPSRDGEQVNVQVIRLVEYDLSTKEVTSYSEKIVFPTERDTLCIWATNFRNDNHPYIFLFQNEVDYVPDDFDPHEALAIVCDKMMPEYYTQLCDCFGVKFKMVREGNSYYKKYYDFETPYYDTNWFTDFADTDMLGCRLHANGAEFGANSCDAGGVSSFSKQYEYDCPDREESDQYTATIFYSKPDRHKQEINYGDGTDSTFPEEVAVMDTDASYFMPTTDDYIIFYVKNDIYTPCNQSTVIVSFDNSGNIVDAKFRLYKPDNQLNPLEELIEWFQLSAGESETLYIGDNIVYFDITNCYDLRHNGDEGVRGDRMSKQELIEYSIDEKSIKMPCESWSDCYGVYISSK